MLCHEWTESLPGCHTGFAVFAAYSFHYLCFSPWALGRFMLFIAVSLLLASS